MKFRYLLSAFVALALAFPAFLSAQPPSQVPVQAYLTDSNGVPVDGDVSVEVSIFDSETGGSAVYTESQTVTADSGSLTVHLGETKSLDLSVFRNNTDLWAEMTVDGETLQPRLKIETAPYAATAGQAEEATNAQQLDGQPASNYQYSAGTGITESNGTFNLDIANSCGSGQVATAIMNDGSLNCSDAASFITTGKGLSKSGNTLRVAGNGIDASLIADNTITGQQVASNAMGQGEIDSGAVGTSELQNNSVTSSEITDGEVKQSDLASGVVTNSEVASNANIDPSKISGTAATTSSGETFNGTVTADDFQYNSSKTVEKRIGVSQFRLSDNQEADQFVIGDAGDGEITSVNDDGAVELSAEVDEIPEGATITEIALYYEDGSTLDGTFDLYLESRDMTSGPGTATSENRVGSVSVTTSSNSFTPKRSSTSFNTTATRSNSYRFELEMDVPPSASDIALIGASVTYSTDGPIPR